jgi:hypothetical protein
MNKGIKIQVGKLRREITADRLGSKIARKMKMTPVNFYRKFKEEKISFRDLNTICELINQDVRNFLEFFEIGDKRDELEKEKAALKTAA